MISPNLPAWWVMTVGPACEEPPLNGGLWVTPCALVPCFLMLHCHVWFSKRWVLAVAEWQHDGLDWLRCSPAIVPDHHSQERLWRTSKKPSLWALWSFGDWVQGRHRKVITRRCSLKTSVKYCMYTWLLFPMYWPSRSLSSTPRIWGLQYLSFVSMLFPASLVAIWPSAVCTREMSTLQNDAIVKGRCWLSSAVDRWNLLFLDYCTHDSYLFSCPQLRTAVQRCMLRRNVATPNSWPVRWCKSANIMTVGTWTCQHLCKRKEIRLFFKSVMCISMSGLFYILSKSARHQNLLSNLALSQARPSAIQGGCKLQCLFCDWYCLLSFVICQWSLIH